MEADGGVSPQRRTFKEKLLHSLSEAEAEDAARQQSVVKDRQQLLIEMLMEGHPQSFVDFFYLTEGEDEKLDQGEEEGGDGEEELAAQSMGYLKENLVEADGAQRRGDLKAVYSAYLNLATFFEQQHNYEKAVYFFERCHGIAQAAADLHGELEATLHLGAAHDALGDTAQALVFHERHLALATAEHLDDEMKHANMNLLAVYCRAAEEHDEDGAAEASVESYHQMMKAAKACQDVAQQGLANYRIGLAYQKAEEASKALGFHSEYLSLCKVDADTVGEGEACCALAQCYQDLGDVAQAISYLEKFLELSKNANPSNHARACCSLGVIYSKQRKFDRAVTYFDKFFEVAKTLHDRRMLDVARVNLGIARGCVRTGRYMDVVANDLTSLLQWKNVRMPLDAY